MWHRMFVNSRRRLRVREFPVRPPVDFIPGRRLSDTPRFGDLADFSVAEDLDFGVELTSRGDPTGYAGCNAAIPMSRIINQAVDAFWPPHRAETTGQLGSQLRWPGQKPDARLGAKRALK